MLSQKRRTTSSWTTEHVEGDDPSPVLRTGKVHLECQVEFRVERHKCIGLRHMDILG